MEKKINKLKAMSEDELDQVAGGTTLDTLDDLKRACDRKLSGFENHKFSGMEWTNWRDSDNNLIGKLTDMFASYGIDVQFNDKGWVPNVYTYQGKEIHQWDAWKIIDSKLSGK